MSHVSIRFLIGLSAPDDPGASHSAARRWSALRILGGSYEALGAYSGTGFWRGSQEPCMMVETVQPDTVDARELARSIAHALAVELGQEAVALTFAPIAFEIIGQDWTPTEGIEPGRYVRDLELN